MITFDPSFLFITMKGKLVKTKTKRLHLTSGINKTARTRLAATLNCVAPCTPAANNRIIEEKRPCLTFSKTSRKAKSTKEPPPYASEHYGVYQPILGWESNLTKKSIQLGGILVDPRVKRILDRSHRTTGCAKQ